jgi:serine/threonine protein kinase
MILGNLVGQTLDGKYKIESEIGKGGMGTVYLSTHVGTERSVAVKIIAPQFMQRAEFVERFRREARAAGRLRHPNVVNVTDFGFAETKNGRVAYLVMEYLDGCTLGEILDEEKQLPLGWTLDILEQVSSAIHEAHGQGIIHRDLKPDNIWLEPNQRGGYTVKVLDFGIAKLEENMHGETGTPLLNQSNNQTQEIGQNLTASDASQTHTITDARNSTIFAEGATIAQTIEPSAEAGTLIQPYSEIEAGTIIQPSAEFDSESGTAILSVGKNNTISLQEDIGTRIISEQSDTEKSLKKSTAELTRVGAVLGTPLYMSPEQCRGEKLDARSDIYSLAVISYQMLAGETPFTGDFKDVMQSHREIPPPPLTVKKVPYKVKKVIYSALSKDPSERPQTAEAFTDELRAHSEGIGSLLRRSLMIYTEHLPKFLSLTILLFLPLIILTILKLGVNLLYIGAMMDGWSISIINAVMTLLTTVVGIFCGYMVFGTTTWLVNQIFAVPLRPVTLRPALAATWRNWKKLLGTGLLNAILTSIGYVICFFPGLYLSVIWALVSPIIMMEGLSGRTAMKRSRMLVRRSLRTTIAASFIMFIVPFFVASLIGFFAATTVKSFSDSKEQIAEIKREMQKESQRREKKAEEKNKADQQPVDEQNPNKDDKTTNEDSKDEKKIDVKINGISINEDNREDDMGKRIKDVTREGLTSILMLPFQILIAPLSSIIIALLYLKTRQAGGESLQDLLEQFEESEQPHSNWQKRVRERLIQSGRVTSKS